MANTITKYIVNNLAEQTIGGSLSAKTLSADTLYVSGNSVSKPYKVYTALLTQTGTDAPEAIVLENTLGVNISYSYVNPGTYYINSDQNIFTEDNLVVLTGSGNVNFLPFLWVSYNGSTQLFIEARNTLNLPLSFNLQDDLLYKQYVEIRVYN